MGDDEWALIYATQGQLLELYHQGQHTAPSNDVPQESERGARRLHAKSHGS